MIHHLKCIPEFFEATDAGLKTFESRLNDRGYRSGDILRLYEWSLEGGYTGRSLQRVVTFVLRETLYCKEGFIIMAIRPALNIMDTVPEVGPMP